MNKRSKVALILLFMVFWPLAAVSAWMIFKLQQLLGPSSDMAACLVLLYGPPLTALYKLPIESGKKGTKLLYGGVYLFLESLLVSSFILLLPYGLYGNMAYR